MKCPRCDEDIGVRRRERGRGGDILIDYHYHCEKCGLRYAVITNDDTVAMHEEGLSDAVYPGSQWGTSRMVVLCKDGEWRKVPDGWLAILGQEVVNKKG